LQIAALIARGANFLLLDEPTNNLDLASIERLEAALLAFIEAGRGAILAISHDRAFLDRVCRRIVELDDGIVRDYPGGFGYYDAHRGEGKELTIRPPAPPAPSERRRKERARR
jgi:ATPase subunit of ABC transporter with duplicated ATPase domains